MSQTNKKTERADQEYSIIYDELMNVVLGLSDDEVRNFGSTQSKDHDSYYIDLFNKMRNETNYSDLKTEYSLTKNLRDQLDYLKSKLIQKVQSPRSKRIQEIQEVENAFHLGLPREGVKMASKLLGELTGDEYWIKCRLLDLIYENLDRDGRDALDENVINSYYALGQTFKNYSILPFESIKDELGSDLLQHLFKFREESIAFDALLHSKRQAIKQCRGTYSTFNLSEGFTYDTSILLEFFNRSFEVVQLILNNKELISDRDKTLIEDTIHIINLTALEYKPALKQLVPNAFTLYMDYLFKNLKCSLVLLNGEIGFDHGESDIDVDCNDINLRIQILNILYQIMTYDEYGKSLMKLEKALEELGSILNKKKAIPINDRLKAELKCCYVLLAKSLRKTNHKAISGSVSRFKIELRKESVYAVFEGKSHLEPGTGPKLIDHVIIKLARLNGLLK